MKTIKSLLAFCIGALLITTACEPNYDIPPADMPVASMTANTTILQLKQAFPNTLDTIGTRPDGTDYIIEGTVIGNDVSGNIYKQLMIQDKTAAITFGVDASSMSATYRLGQKIVVDVTGMQIGLYNSAQQIGTTYNGKIGRMSSELFEANTQLSGWPDATADTLVMTIAELNALTSNAQRMPVMSQLIRINDVYFSNPGSPYAVSSTYYETVKDSLGNSVQLVNSNYSNFYTEKMPAGKGDIVAIATAVYNGVYQMTLVDIKGVMDFDGTSTIPSTPSNPSTPSDPASGNGTEASPYNVSAAIANQTGAEVYVTGYIVGCAPGKSISEGIETEAPFTASSNVLLADSPTETDASKMLPVQLPTGDIRNAVNLSSNPTNIGRKVTLQGTATAYFGQPGLKTVTSYAWAEGGTTPETPSDPETGAGTEASPYDVAAAIANQTNTAVYVTGYIIACAPGKSISDGLEYAAPFTAVSNVLLADDLKETDTSKMLPVQLPSGDVRKAINLTDNPTNIGKKVTLLGTATAYFGQPGLKSVTDYKWVE